MPLLSILMPVYNGERYLRPAVTGILRQDFRDFEFIAVDDGSTDGSKRILESFAKADARLRVLSRANSGIVGALNDGLALAQGELIARMDCDDIALPGRLQAQVDFLQSHPECVALGTAVQIIDSYGAVVDRYDPPLEHDGIVAELFEGNGGALIHPSAVFRASALRAIGGYDPAFCKAEDVDLYFRLSRHGRLANLPMLGLQYRHHVRSTNFQHREIQRGLLNRILAREAGLRGERPRLVALRGHTDLSRGQLHARYACSALAHGRRLTAIRHGVCAVIRAEGDRECWRALRYVLTARRPVLEPRP